MPGSLTGSRTFNNVAIGAKWQTAEGTPQTSFTSNTKFLLATELRINPNHEIVDPQGTHGSTFRRKDGVRTMSNAYQYDITLYATKDSVPVILESVMGYEMTVSNANLTETGDTSGVLGSWSLKGVRPEVNTNADNKIYVFVQDETPSAGKARVKLYSNSAQTTLIAQGSGSNGTTILLVEQGNSALSGSLALGTVGASNSGVVLTINTLTANWGPNVHDHLTVAFFDGSNTRILSDAHVQKAEFSSSESQELMITATVLGKSLTTTTTQVTASISDFASYAHNDLTITRAPSGSNTTLVASDFSWSIDRPTKTHIANASKPQKYIREGFVSVGGKVTADYADQTLAIITNALATTYERINAAYTFSSKTLSAVFYNVFYEQTEVPGFGAEAVADVMGTFRADYDGTNNPIDITIGI